MVQTRPAPAKALAPATLRNGAASPFAIPAFLVVLLGLTSWVTHRGGALRFYLGGIVVTFFYAIDKGAAKSVAGVHRKHFTQPWLAVARCAGCPTGLRHKSVKAEFRATLGHGSDQRGGVHGLGFANGP